MRKILYILFLIATTCFSQTDIAPTTDTPTDSAAYYEQLYQYNLDSYNYDKKAANISLITAGVSTGLAAISAIAIIVYDLDQHSKDDSYTTMSMSHPWVIATLALCGIGVTSAFVYGGFEVAASERKSNYLEYDFKRKKHATHHAINISVAPIIDPINENYGGALALNF